MDQRNPRSRRPIWLTALLGILMVPVLAWPASAAPITFNTALPVAEGEFIARAQVIVNQSGDDPSGADRDRTAWTAASVLGYGMTGDLAVFGVVPLVERRLESTVNGARRARSARGIGDASAFGRYTIFKHNFRGGSFRVAPFAGVKFPTGADNESDAFGRLPASVQPGSGSWDPFGGVVVTYQVLDFQIDAQASYKVNNEANDFEFGDIARLDASFQYRLWPRELKGGVPGFLYAILEANLVYQGKNRSGGVANPNSNGTRLFLVPALQWVERRWIVEAAVQLPVLQDLNGTALENDHIARLSVRVNF